MPVNKTLAALEKVVAALTPLDPEERRQVIEATHALVEVSSGCCDGEGEMGGAQQGFAGGFAGSYGPQTGRPAASAKSKKR